MKRAFELCVLPMTLLLGCGGAEPEPDLMECSVPVEGELLLGALLPHDGVWPVGEFLERGVALAVDEINRAGGIGHRRLGLAVCNTGGKPEVGTRLMRALAAHPRIGAVVGPARSAVMLGGVADVAIETGTVVMSPGATSPEISTLEDANLVYRTTVSDAVQGVVLARIAEREGLSRVRVLQSPGDPYTRGIREKFVAAFEANMGEGVAPFELMSTEDDPAALFARIEDDGAEGVVISAFATQAQSILERAATHPWRAGKPPVWLLPDGMKSETALPALMALTAAGARVVGINPATPEGAAYREYAANHRRAHGEAPGVYSAHAYDAAYLLAAAMLASDAPTEGPALVRALQRTQPGEAREAFGPNQWSEIRASLLRGQSFDYLGAAGDQDFDELGDVLSGIEEWAVENEQFTHKRCWTATAEPCE